MEDSIDIDRPPHYLASSLQHVVDRYYERFYAIDVGGERQDLYVHQHLNGLLVIGLAPTHPLLASGSVISRVEFSNAGQQPSGKSKKGGMICLPESTLCTVTCADGNMFIMHACIRGMLLEINDRLLSQPQLLQEKAATDGWIAILQPQPRDESVNMQRLLPRDRFESIRGHTEINKAT